MNDSKNAGDASRAAPHPEAKCLAELGLGSILPRVELLFCFLFEAVRLHPDIQHQLCRPPVPTPGKPQILLHSLCHHAQAAADCCDAQKLQHIVQIKHA